MNHGSGGEWAFGSGASAGTRGGSGLAARHGLAEDRITTTFELPGQRIVRTHGVVRGITVRSRSIVGNIAGMLQSLAGGNISVFTHLCEQAREEAFSLMCHHAASMGANAIVAVRYDATELSPGLTEVLCYGTAVTVEHQ